MLIRYIKTLEGIDISFTTIKVYDSMENLDELVDTIIRWNRKENELIIKQKEINSRLSIQRDKISKTNSKIINTIKKSSEMREKDSVNQEKSTIAHERYETRSKEYSGD